MDRRVILLKDFYRTMQPGKVKVESNYYGFDFLEKIVIGGTTLEYGQMTACGYVHKYKLHNVPDYHLNQLLEGHINKECNVCMYFDEMANNTLCFNLDNNHKLNNTVVIPEMKLAVTLMREYLTELDMEPFVIASGRGFHIWCRFDTAIRNELLYVFMLRLAARTMAALSKSGFDYHTVKCNMYPNNRIINDVSLRLFGSEHIKNKAFCHVHTPSGILDEADSWDYFADYLKYKSVTTARFGVAADKLEAYF